MSLPSAAVAPGALAAGTIIEFDDGANGDFTAAVVIEILSATELARFSAAVAAPANGEYSYVRISESSAILTYFAENSDGTISAGEILLEFANANGGSFSSTAEGEGESASGVFELHSNE